MRSVFPLPSPRNASEHEELQRAGRTRREKNGRFSKPDNGGIKTRQNEPQNRKVGKQKRKAETTKAETRFRQTVRKPPGTVRKPSVKPQHLGRKIGAVRPDNRSAPRNGQGVVPKKGQGLYADAYKGGTQARTGTKPTGTKPTGTNKGRPQTNTEPPQGGIPPQPHSRHTHMSL